MELDRLAILPSPNHPSAVGFHVEYFDLFFRMVCLKIDLIAVIYSHGAYLHVFHCCTNKEGGLKFVLEERAIDIARRISTIVNGDFQSS